MTPITSEFEAAARMAIAALVGIGVGLEREWSGHAAGPHARFAGLRTFLLLGLLGGGAGLLIALGVPVAGAVVAGGAMGLGIAAYVMAVRRPEEGLDGTTEAAALAVVAIGTLAGVGWIALAAGTGSLVVLALSEKTRLHWLVQKVGETELRAALQFAVLALVVLPLLPEGPYWHPLDVRPRALWTIVLVFSGLNFAGFLARRGVGLERGYPIVGLVGGVISSTLVTLDFSRRSRSNPEHSGPLANGVIGACTVLVPRVAILSAVLGPSVARALVPLMLPMLVVGIVIFALGWRAEHGGPASATRSSENPLRLLAAIRLTIAFQVTMSVLAAARSAWGTSGLFASSVLLGLTDVDALTAAMSQPSNGLAATDAARAIAIGILTNTVVKLAIALALGSNAFRRRAGLGLLALGAAGALGLWVA